MVRPLKDNKATFSQAATVGMDWTSGRSVVSKPTVKTSSLGNLFCNLQIVIVIIICLPTEHLGVRKN